MVVERILGVAFAILLALELAVLVIVGALVAWLPYFLWQRSPWRAMVAVLGLGAVGVALWKSHRRSAAAWSQLLPASGPEISVSHIPITGPVGALYMLQFLVWVLLVPAVGLVYAALVAGALLLLPLIHYMNRPGRSPSAVGLGGLLGTLCGLAVATLVSMREFPLAGMFGIALVAGVVGAPVLIWLRSRQKHVSIAPYSQGHQ
jgi:hypothetical protein